MGDYGIEVGTTVQYIGLNADPNDKMQDILERVEQAAETETNGRSTFLNEIVINENDDGSYAIKMLFVDEGPFVGRIEFDGDVGIMDELPKEAMSGTVKSFMNGHRFGEKQYLDNGHLDK